MNQQTQPKMPTFHDLVRGDEFFITSNGRKMRLRKVCAAWARDVDSKQFWPMLESDSVTRVSR